MIATPAKTILLMFEVRVTTKQITSRILSLFSFYVNVTGNLLGWTRLMSNIKLYMTDDPTSYTILGIGIDTTLSTVVICSIPIPINKNVYVSTARKSIFLSTKFLTTFCVANT